MATSESQRVVVIQDASSWEVSVSAIVWVLEGLSLGPGDKLTLMGVLHQVNNPSMLSFKGAKELLGYKVKVDSGSIFGANHRIVAKAVARKIEEYENNPDIIYVSKQCESKQIEFRVEVRAGSSSRMVALKAAKSMKATWVILDRHMKKDKKFFMDKLYCGISRMKRDNSIEKLRGPKLGENIKLVTERRRTSHVTYDEMIPGSPPSRSSSPQISSGKEKGDGYEESTLTTNKLPTFSKSSSSEQLMTTIVSTISITEASSSSFTEAKSSPVNFNDELYTTNTELETAGEESPTYVGGDEENAHNTGSPDEQQNQHNTVTGDWLGGSSKHTMFEKSICPICKNIRPKIGWTRDFTYAELHTATEGFSPTNFLSEGGFGSVYRGQINGQTIAVKQHKNASLQGEKEFESEVQVLSKARHENLVMLLGYCSEGNDKLLVYEYVCNGSVDQHLSKHARRPLSWERRMKIALGAARGLEYLHKNNIIHRDMRPNNILVTHNYESMLGDFGLARTQHDDPDHSSDTRVVGTLGYLAPEYAECGKVSTKTDVYAFGVVLLQLITGLKTTDKILKDKCLVGWARPLLKERNYPNLIDPRILACHDMHQLFWMIRVAEKCLSKDPHKRFSMDKVVYALKRLMEGDTMSNIKDLSPTLSDSDLSSTQDSSSSSSPADDTSFTNTESSLISSMRHDSGRLPPSPSIAGISTRKQESIYRINGG